MTLHLTKEQHELLLKKIHKDRVSSRDGMAYVEAHDDKAHLIRIFGFGGFDSEVVEQTLLFDEQVTTSNNKPAFHVAYRSVVKLTVWDQCGCKAVYTEGHVGASTHPRRDEAHGNAVTNSESYALKRCCVFLGDQYGLSLYNKGQRDAIVRWTLVKPPKPEEGQQDDQPDTDDIPAVHQESLEADPVPEPRVTTQTPAVPLVAAGPVSGGDSPPSAPPETPSDDALREVANRIRERAIGDPDKGFTPSRWISHLMGEAIKAKVLMVPVESLIAPVEVPLKLALEQALKQATDRARAAS